MVTTAIDTHQHVGPACHATGIRGLGNTTEGIVLVGVAPGADEIRNSKKPMTGNSGKFTNAILDFVGVPRDRCYATNVFCYAIGKDTTLADVGACGDRLRAELEEIKPRVIIALGNIPIEFFTGMVPGKVRHQLWWSDEFNCWILPSYQPAIVFQQPDTVADIVRDFRKIELCLQHPEGRAWGNVEYEVAKTPDAARGHIQRWVSEQPRFLSNDIECHYDYAAQKYIDRIRCVGLSDGDRTVVIPDFVLELLTPEDFPRSLNWTFHNGMFDTAKLKLAPYNIDLPIVEDTLIMGYSLDERGGDAQEGTTELPVGIHDLKRNSREYVGAGFYEKSPKDCTDEELWEYNAHDAAYTARLAKYFYTRQLADGGVRQAYEELMLPTAYTFREQHTYGIYTNPENVRDIAIEWLRLWLDEEEALTTEAYNLGWRDPKTSDRINMNSPQQLKKFFNNTLMLGVANTQADTLKDYYHIPWVRRYQSWKRLDKMLSVYVTGVQEQIDENGYIHPIASIQATRTGRASYKRPPVQTIPTGHQYYDPDDEDADSGGEETERYSKLRTIVGAPPGKVFIEADYAQAELWVAALYTHDLNMIEDLQGDFHSSTAERMWKRDRTTYTKQQWSHIRRLAKYVTFGKLYGRTTKALWTGTPGIPGDLSMYSFKEVQEIVAAWEERYHTYMSVTREWVSAAFKSGEQEFISHRKRRYFAPALFGNHFTNMAMNAPIQAVSHDHLVHAMNELYLMFERGECEARPLWDGHDAIYFECPPDALLPSIDIIKTVMGKPRYFELGLRPDIKVGTNWGNVQELGDINIDDFIESIKRAV